MMKTRHVKIHPNIEEQVRGALKSEPRLGPSFHLRQILFENDGSLVLERADIAAKKLALERAAAIPGVTGIVGRLQWTRSGRALRAVGNRNSLDFQLRRWALIQHSGPSASPFPRSRSRAWSLPSKSQPVPPRERAWARRSRCARALAATSRYGAPAYSAIQRR